MPEGPELHLSSRFVKKVGDVREFVGKIVERLPANRPPKLDDINSRLNSGSRYSLTSWSRGKELMLSVKPLDSSESKQYCPGEWTVRFNFGMTGCFKLTKTSELPKHAKVCFTAVGEPACTLSFVDMRGFGRWTVTDQWSENRGPCILQERQLFRSHVLSRLADCAFNKPICEVMLDQRYFNGVGNYLRAEVLHRLGLQPFACARDLLSPLPAELKVGKTDLLEMCHQLAAEVVSIGGGRRYDVPLDVLETMMPAAAAQDAVKAEPGHAKEEEGDAFEMWLRCYYQPGMKNLVDHQGRTVWFGGDPGPLVPKARKQRHEKSPKKPKGSVKSPKSAGEEDSDEEYNPPSKRTKRVLNRRSKSPRHEQKLEKDALPSRKANSKVAISRSGSAGGNVKKTSFKEVPLKNGSTSVSRRKSAVKDYMSSSESKVSVKCTKGPAPGERRSKRLSGKRVQS